MNRFITYFKQNPERLLMLIAAFFLISYFVSFGVSHLFLFAFYALAENESHKSFNNFLDKQGLTAGQYADKKFVESWTETRQAGLTRYCFFDGGIIIGSMLSIVIGCIFMKSGLLGDVMKDFTGMMELIWKSFVLGFIIATVINRLRWPYRDKRFAKLTGSHFELK